MYKISILLKRQKNSPSRGIFNLQHWRKQIQNGVCERGENVHFKIFGRDFAAYRKRFVKVFFYVGYARRFIHDRSALVVVNKTSEIQIYSPYKRDNPVGNHAFGVNKPR